MSEVSFASAQGVDDDDSMEGSRFSYFHVIETLIESDVDEVDPLMSHDEEVASSLKGREASLHSIPINFKESRSNVDRNDMECFL